MALSDITKTQIEDLRNRRITGRALAKHLGISEDWLSKNYPGHKINKIPGLTVNFNKEKKELRASRDEFRTNLALKVRSGGLTAKKMSALAHCSIRTAYRKIEQLAARALPETRLP